jgi:glutathione reductase (NADPH)
MTRQFDLVVIGTGTAASVAAYHCQGAGWRVAVIDHLPFGGTCALRGCDPKKVLVGLAECSVRALRGWSHGLPCRWGYVGKGGVCRGRQRL